MEDNPEEKNQLTEPADIPAEEGGPSFDLIVSEDEMEACLVIKGRFEMSGEEARNRINQVLAGGKIAFGIDETVIDQCLAELFSEGLKEYVVARGVQPKPGKDAAILFKLGDEKKIGKLDEYAKMDFRERGDIPYVEAGDLLAIKSPMVKGEGGSTVTGKAIPAAPVHDAALKAGKNVRIVGGERAEAKVSGAVYIDSQQRIEISPVFRVDGDVDYATGNINFDGLVQVSGAVLSGFRVKASGLMARLIERDTRIEVTGDLTVTDGIIGSEVKAAGVIKCGYIRGSRVVAEGDVTVDVEILDSYVSSLGTVVVSRPNGRIVNSTIISKKGVEAYNLGSPSSPRSVIIIGLDYQSDTHIQALNEEVFRYEESLHKLEEKFKEIAAIKKYVEDEVELIKKKLPSSLNTRQKYRLHTQYKDLCLRQKELHKNYHCLLDAIVTFKGKIEELEARRRHLMAERVRVEPDVYLKVRGMAFEGNIVRGKMAFMEFPENKKVMRAHETIIYRDREDGGQEKDIRIELEPM
jgi:uncharacterized protein (DUF342 family)